MFYSQSRNAIYPKMLWEARSCMLKCENLRRRYEREREPQVVVKQQELNPINMCMPRSFSKVIKRCCFFCVKYKRISIVKLFDAILHNINWYLYLINFMLFLVIHFFPSDWIFITTNTFSDKVTMNKNANSVHYCIYSGYRINIEGDNPRSCKWMLKSRFFSDEKIASL